MMPKNRIANISIAAVGAMALTPLSIIGPISGPNPPSSAKIIGTKISAVSTDMRFVMMRAINATIMANA